MDIKAGDSDKFKILNELLLQWCITDGLSMITRELASYSIENWQYKSLRVEFPLAIQKAGNFEKNKVVPQQKCY